MSEQCERFQHMYRNCFGTDELPKLQVLGGGKMALALVEGFLKTGCFAKENVSICTKSHATSIAWKEEGYVSHTTTTFYKDVQPSGVILIAVKPQVVQALAAELTSQWKIDESKCIVVSIMAGLTTEQLNKELKVSTIRLMPSVNCAVGAGAVLVCASNSAISERVNLVVELGSKVGYCTRVDESVFNAAASVSGCAPAYIFMVIEALADGGVSNGLSRELALRLAAETVKGSAQLYLASDKHLARLKDEVCSPAGTTIAGVRELEKRGLKSAIIEALHASTNRASELSQAGKKNND